MEWMIRTGYVEEACRTDEVDGVVEDNDMIRIVGEASSSSTPCRTKRHKCIECGYKTNDKSSITDHCRIHVHTGEKPYECELCHQKFRFPSNLQVHLKTHQISGVKRLECTLCDARVVTRQELQTHMRSHTGEKPYSCALCDFKCSQRGHLTMHVRTHTNEKPFKLLNQAELPSHSACQNKTPG